VRISLLQCGCEIAAKLSTKTVKGTIYAASSTNKTITVTSSGSRTIYTYDADTKFTLDGKDSTLTNAIKKDYEATLTVDSTKYIVKIEVVSPEDRIIAKITKVDDEIGYIVVEDDEGDEYILMDNEIDEYDEDYDDEEEDYYFDEDTEYEYNGAEKTYDKIAKTTYLYKKGNYVAITLGKKDFIDLLEVATKKSTLTGETDDDDDNDDPLQDGGIGSGDIVYGSDDQIYDPDTNENVKYGSVINEYYAKITEKLLDGNVSEELEKYISDYFASLYDGTEKDAE